METPQHQVGAVILLIYLNSQKELEVLLSLPQERCIIFGNDNENIYKEGSGTSYRNFYFSSKIFYLYSVGYQAMEDLFLAM